MRFSAVAVVASSAVAYAQSPAETDYVTSTRVSTITSCAPDVPDCPAATEAPVETESYTTSTVYATHVNTIIDCADDVPDCPAHSTIIVTETVPVSTTVCPVGPPTEYPHPPSPPHGGNGTTPEYPGKPEHPGKPEQPETPEQPEQPECPSYTTTHITKEHVTTITTVETKTVEVPCPEETKPVSPPVVTPPPHGGNETIPKPPTEAPPTEAGAAGLAGSAVFAAVAGFAAFILA
ncbi:hypothetical protein CC79DRAFT_1362144 [Sarocladium strictum]